MPPFPDRISLAEASRQTGALMHRGEVPPVGAGPHLSDLTECLFFAPGDGRIWLNDQRMVLMHTASIGTLRRELIETLGLDRARGLLTRTGYESGARDARLVREHFPDAEPVPTFMAGTRLHALEGVVKVIPVEFEIDPSAATTTASSCGSTRPRTTSTSPPTASAPSRRAGCSSATPPAT